MQFAQLTFLFPSGFNSDRYTGSDVLTCQTGSWTASAVCTKLAGTCDQAPDPVDDSRDLSGCINLPDGSTCEVCLGQLNLSHRAHVAISLSLSLSLIHVSHVWSLSWHQLACNAGYESLADIVCSAGSWSQGSCERVTCPALDMDGITSASTCKQSGVFEVGFVFWFLLCVVTASPCLKH